LIVRNGAIGRDFCTKVFAVAFAAYTVFGTITSIKGGGHHQEEKEFFHCCRFFAKIRLL
jgi:hypothetical protein